MHEDLLSLLGKVEFTRREFVVTSLAAGFALSVQPVSAQTITTDTAGLEAGEVKVPVKDGEIPAYRAMPDKGGPFPTVLVVQEIFGVHEHIKDICRRLAKLGYFAIAPEMYARQGDVSKISRLPGDLLQGRLEGPRRPGDVGPRRGRGLLPRRPGKADTSKLAITGFCWGGRIVWLYAAHNPDLKAGVAWYGRLKRPDDPNVELQPSISRSTSPPRSRPPFWASMAGPTRASRSPPSRRCAEALKAAGNTTAEIVVYPDTPHAFYADYRPSYRKEQADDGWKKLLEWFKKNGVA